MSSSEAVQYKNRCKKCFECPQCFTTLAIQAGDAAASSTQTITSLKSDPISPVKTPSQTPGSPATPSTPTSSDPNAKSFFVCGFCRWNSSDIPELKADNPSQLTSKALEREKEDPLLKDNAKLVEFLQKEEKEKVKEKRQVTVTPRRKSIVSGGRSPLAMKPTSVGEVEGRIQTKRPSSTPPPPKEILEKYEKPDEKVDLSTDDTSEYEKELNLNTVTTLQQRFLQMTAQPTSTSQLFPKRKQLLTRRSKHCRRCDKLLVKPDLSPAKIDFKRHHVAFFSLYLPRISIARPLVINPQEPLTVFLLRVHNPLLSFMDITISKLTTVVPEDTLEVKFAPISTFLAPKDHDDDEKDQTFKALKQKDDTQVIQERKFNWVLLKAPMTVKQFTNVKLSLKYKSTASGEQATTFTVRFNLGAATQYFKKTATKPKQ